MEVKKMLEKLQYEELADQLALANWKFSGTWIFPSKDEAMEVATGMHKMLAGIDDYVENRIVLNVDGCQVSLTVYADAAAELEIGDISTKPHITKVTYDPSPEAVMEFVRGGCR